MATFDCVIDTKPMADAVISVSNSINTTTDAVTAMKQAVIKTEEDAAANICKNVDRGFFSLIRSKLSMKLAECYTDMNAKLVLLNQFTRTLLSTQSRMEVDLNRIKREYHKTFQGLDKSLENRISQIDKPAMQLAQIRKSLFTTRMLRDVSNTIYEEKETQDVVQLILQARIKNKTSRALSRVNENVCENQQYKNQLQMLMEDQSNVNKTDSSIPVLYIEAQSMVVKDSNYSQIYFPEFLSKSSQNLIKSKIMDNFDIITNEGKSETEYSEIKEEFFKLVASSDMNDRTQNVIKALYENGRI